MAVFGYILAADEDEVHMQGYDLQDAGAADLYTDYGDDDLERVRLKPNRKRAHIPLI